MHASLQDPPAIALNKDFIEDMHSLDKEIEDRNERADSWTRSRQNTRKAMPYTLMKPGSPPGRSMMGVPYSVSI